MRLGEIASTVREATDESDQLLIDNEPLFGGQAYVIHNYGDLMSAINVLQGLSWNQVDIAPIESIQQEHGADAQEAQLLQEQFNQLNSYVSTVNQKLPTFLSMVDSVVEEQDPQVINVKLPSSINSLSSLSTQNQRLVKLFKEFTVDGKIEFVGFDKGSDWYVLCLTGVVTYNVFVGCLKIAQEYFKARNEYFKSKKAELDYKAALKLQGTEFSDEDFDRYQEERMGLEIEDRVRKVVGDSGEKNGFQVEELHTKLVIATKDLVKELGRGAEFHLSLNPPTHASERGGSLRIDYKKIREITQAETKPKKRISTGEKPETADKKPVDKD